MTGNYWHDLQRKRLSRRGVIRIAGASGLGIAAIGVLGCGGGGSGPSGSQSFAGESAPGAAPIPSLGNPRPGGIYLIVDSVVATHRSPYHSGNEASQVRPLFQTMYDVLWTKKATTTDPLELQLAESFEQVDQTTVTVKLKRGTRFHNRAPANGREVTAEDIALDIAFIQDPAGRANLNSTFIRTDLDGPPQVIDNYTLRFKTKGPRFYFYDTDQVAVSIVPKEMLNESTLREAIQVGSGPWEYKDERQGSIYEVQRFANYRVRGKPYPDGIKLTIVPDVAAREAAFRSGQAHQLTFTDIRNRDAVVRDLGKQIYTRSTEGTGNTGLVLNMFRPEAKDVRFREAIWNAIDRDRLINVIVFGDGLKTGYFPYERQDIALTREDVTSRLKFDQAKTRQLLSATGIDLNKEYTFPLPVEAQSYVDAGRLISEDLARVGIKTKLEPIPRTQFITRVGSEPGEFDFSLWPFQGTNVRQQMRMFHSKEGSFQESFSLNDPEIDALVEKSEATLDSAAFGEVVRQVQRLLFQRFSNWIPTFTGNSHTGYYAFVRGIDFTPQVPSASGGHPYQLDRWLDKQS